MSENKIILIGGGGHAKVLASIILKSGRKIAGYISEKPSEDFENIEYLGNEDNIDYKRYTAMESSLVMAIGQLTSSELREKLYSFYKEKGYSFTNVISPKSITNENALICEGTVIFDGAIVNTGTKISEMCIVNTGAIIEHDCTIGKFTHVAPGAIICGNVNLGNSVLIGAGAVVNNNVSICDNVIIGSGTVVYKDIKEAGTYVGNSIRKIK